MVVIGKEERASGHHAGVVHVREVFGRGEKADRAKPLATAYERGRVCHVRGAALGELEETLTTWEPVPGSRSPDRLDALVYAVGELLGLDSNASDPTVAFRGLTTIGALVSSSTSPNSIGAVQVGGLAALLGGGGGGGRI